MPSEMVGTKGAAPFASRMSNERSAVELRPDGVPSWIDFPSLASQMPQVGMFAIANCNLTNNLTLRTRLLCKIELRGRNGRRAG